MRHVRYNRSMKCPICNEDFESRRSDAETCQKSACRKKWQRMKKKGALGSASKVFTCKFADTEWMTLTDRDFDNHAPGYYHFDTEVYKGNCMECDTPYVCHLQFLKFCSRDCQVKMLNRLVGIQEESV